MTDTLPNSAPIFRYTVAPRYTDLDTWRHINNSRLYQIHQEARIRMQIELFGRNAWFSDGVRLRPMRTVTQYRHMSWYDSDIEAEVSVLECDAEGVRLRSELFQNGVAVGHQECVMIALEDGVRVPVPDDIRARFAERCSQNAPPLEPADYSHYLPAAQAFPHQQSLTPRYADLDADSQRSEAALGRYIEQARFGSMRGMDLGGVGIVIASADISFLDYHAGWAPVALTSGIRHIGNRSFSILGCASQDGIVQALAQSVMVLVDRVSGRPVAIPDGLRAQLEKRQADTPEPA